MLAPILTQNPRLEVDASYYKTMAIISYDRNPSIWIIDVIGNTVLWAFETKSGNCGLVRFAKTFVKKGKVGFMARGQFIPLYSKRSSYRIY